MKQIFFFTFAMLILSGCDAPIRNRTPGSFQNMNGLNNSNSNGSNNNAISYNPGDLSNSTGTTTGVTTGGGSIDTNFPSCDLSTKYYTTSMGYFGLCQGSNETQIKVKFSMTTSSRNCLIPTYKDANGSSTYIGQPQCTYVNQANTEIQGSLPKNRSGFESYSLNGVMVMKEELLPNYFKCMHAYVDWLNQICPYGPQSSQQCYITYSSCPYGARTNASCGQAASQHMSNVCNSFKSTYSNQYVDVRTK